MANGIAVMTKTDSEGTHSIYQLSDIEGVEVYAESRETDLGDSMKQKYVDAIVVHLENRASLVAAHLYIYHRDYQDEAFVEDGPYDLYGANPVSYPQITARFFKFKILDSQPSVKWKWSKIEIYGQLLDGVL